MDQIKAKYLKPLAIVGLTFAIIYSIGVIFTLQTPYFSIVRISGHDSWLIYFRMNIFFISSLTFRKIYYQKMFRTFFRGLKPGFFCPLLKINFNNLKKRRHS